MFDYYFFELFFILKNNKIKKNMKICFVYFFHIIKNIENANSYDNNNF